MPWKQVLAFRANITVKPSYGLDDDQIAGMLEKTALNLQKLTWMHASCVRQQVEAQRLVESVEAAIAKDRDLLEADELTSIQASIDSLRVLAQSDNVRAIEQGIEDLGHLTEDFAARRMDAGIRKALTGKTIDTVSATLGGATK